MELIVEQKHMEQNIFIEFKIIQESNPEKLSKELDILIAKGNRIFTWSKTVSPRAMRSYCLNTEIVISKKERETHKKIQELKYDGMSYQEISDQTGVPIKQLGWYIFNRADKKWTLDDWIADYYIKDSSVYKKVDIIIDPDPVFVSRFTRTGLKGNVTGPIK